MTRPSRPFFNVRSIVVQEFYGNPWIATLCLFFIGLVCVAYPLCLILEFWTAPGGGTLELFKLYPHMTVIPPLLFWAIFLITAAAVSAAWSEKAVRFKVKLCIALSLFVTIGVTYDEATRSPLMLLELAPDAHGDTTWSELYKRGRSMLAEKQSQPVPQQITPEQTAMANSLNYQYWRSQHRFSVTRAFYVATFSLSVFALLTAFAAIFHVPRGKNQQERDRYLYQLLGAFFCYALWFPSRFYYNLEIKSRLTGSAERLPGRDLILYMIGAGFLIFVCARLVSHIPRWRQITGLVVIFVLPITSIFASPSLGNVFGLESNPMIWFALFSAFLYLFIGFRTLLPVRQSVHRRTSNRQQHPK